MTSWFKDTGKSIPFERKKHYAESIKQTEKNPAIRKIYFSNIYCSDPTDVSVETMNKILCFISFSEVGQDIVRSGRRCRLHQSLRYTAYTRIHAGTGQYGSDASRYFRPRYCTIQRKYLQGATLWLV